MGAVKVLKPVSLAEYLRSEPDSRQRREYVRGTVRAIARASEQHNRLAGRVYARLLQAEDRGCRAFIGDMRLDIGDVQYYPDVILVCQDDPYQKRHPCVLVEVLSPSTRNTDLLEKRLAYTGIESLQLYLILEPQHPKVVGYYRIPEGFEERQWEGEGTVEVPCAGISLELSELYQNL